MTRESSAAPTRVHCTIDLDAQGFQDGFAYVTHSNNEHAYGVIPVPIACFNNGDGPTVLVTAGNHGDEHEGPIIARKLIRDTLLESIRGRLIVMPALNYPAVLENSRISPIDQGNMNRAYPGDPSSTPTFAIAHFVETVLLPKCHFALDLHSGGKASEFLPCAFLVRTGEPEFLAKKVAAAEAFGAPTTCVVAGTADQRSLSAAADRHGVINIATELAGGGTVGKHALTVGETGTRRWLQHTGVLDDATICKSEGTQFLRVRDRNDFVVATIDGVFEPNVDLGDAVTCGDVAGWLHPVATTTAPCVELKFNADGVVLCRRVPARAIRGDYLFHLGMPVDADGVRQEN